METIYLVGQISPKFKESYKWRKRVRDHFEFRDDIQIIDPCSNPFNREVLNNNSYAVTKESRVNGIDLLPPKDLTYCQRSSIAIVNMNHYDLNKPLLGSYFELAWYYTMPEKAVIAFSEDLSRYECQHPFVKQTVHVWCNTEAEACDLVDRYFVSVEGI